MLRYFIILLAVTSIQAAPASGTETEVQPTPLPTSCAEQDITVTVWKSQNVIYAVELERIPPTVIVDRRRWLRLPERLQLSIALASYCRMGAVDQTATMQVVDTGESLFGTVSRGKWKNRLTGK
jgi:hypothetical protein